MAHDEIGSVLLKGSGLTMIDAALRLAAIRPRLRHIHVLSRHGLLPLAQAASPRPLVQPDVSGVLAACGSVRDSLRALRTLACEVTAAGGDWRAILAVLRSQVPTIWGNLPAAERRRFLRHARAVWEIHRHRAPPGPLAAVRNLARAGVLQVHAGRFESLRAVEDAMEVTWRPRGAVRTRAWLVDRVINCTGPDHRADRNSDPLVQSMLANGLICADELGLGLELTADGKSLSADGVPLEGLHYVGPWLRARDWEATAVPELRVHAAKLAQRLAGEQEHAIARGA